MYSWRNSRSWIYYYNYGTGFSYYDRYAYCCDTSYYYYYYYCSYYYACDNYFTICIRPTSSYGVSTTTCYDSVTTPQVGGDSLNFGSTLGTGSSAVDNPITFTDTGSNRPVSGGNYYVLSILYKFPIQDNYQILWIAYDEDGTYDPIIDYSYYNYYSRAKNSYWYTNMYGYSGGSYTRMYLRHKWYCPDNYYETYCTKYCADTDDVTGHYTCDDNGDPVCLDGWTGASTFCKTGKAISTIYYS